MKKILTNQILILLSKSSILVGGQAVIEGVMMRVPGYISTAVRNPDGNIITKRQEFNTLVKKYKWLNFPIIRGAISLFEALKIGFGTLQWSADISFPEDKQKQSKFTPILEWMMTIFSIVFALSLFILLPLGLTSWLSNSDQHPMLYNMIAGAIRIAIFLSYLLLISKTKDARRLFEYHGAEHKVVYTFENGDDLTVANSNQYPTQHPRCGTSFMFIVMFVAILTFMVIETLYIQLFGEITLLNRLFMHVLFIPLVSGIGYEILKFSSQHQNNIVLKYLIKPGLWLQNITTSPPDDAQLEVALKALTSAFGDTLDEYQGKKHIADAIG
jgi:uncharacterized protein YqhQ